MENSNIPANVMTHQFSEVVNLIRQTRNDVISIANTALIDLYWKIGAYISVKIHNSEWGDGVVRQLADHITQTCPGIKGFSDKNLWRMKRFYETYVSADEKLSAVLRQISWTNNLIVMTRTKSAEERDFYLNLCVKERLSSRELDRQIDSAMYERSIVGQPKLSPVMREIVPDATNVFRDHYVMEFIGRGVEAEKYLEVSESFCNFALVKTKAVRQPFLNLGLRRSFIKRRSNMRDATHVVIRWF